MTVKRVVIAPDKFKGSLTAIQAADAIERGVLTARPDATCLLAPMADGGEGTVAIFLQRGARRKSAHVHGPLGKMAEAVYALRDDGTAILEMSSASGLALLDKSEYDPWHASTFGTGELLRAALDAGAKHVLIGIGGSATNDAGVGMLRALGARFVDSEGTLLGTDIASYVKLAEIDLRGIDPRLSTIRTEVAVDVDNPLCGDDGATRTYGAQKGVLPDDIAALDRVLEHIADVTAHTVRHDYRNAHGAGAAGGLGFALLAFLAAKMEPGVALIARECNLEEQLDGAALCLTGEGKIDGQTLHGKTVSGVGGLCRAHDVPVVAFGGAVESAAKEQLERSGIEVVRIAPENMPVDVSMRQAAALLEAAAKAVAHRLLQ